MATAKYYDTRHFMLELPTPAWEWLGRRADERGITVDEVVSEILMEKCKQQHEQPRVKEEMPKEMSKEERERRIREFWAYYKPTQGSITITDPKVLD